MNLRTLVISLSAMIGAAILAVPDAGAQTRYRTAQAGDVVTLSDTRANVVVNVLTTASNAYQMTANGEDVIRRNWSSLDDIRARMGLNGIPLYENPAGPQKRRGHGCDAGRHLH